MFIFFPNIILETHFNSFKSFPATWFDPFHFKCHHLDENTNALQMQMRSREYKDDEAFLHRVDT